MRSLLAILILLCSTCGCVHAQGTWSVPASGTGTVGPASGPVAPPCTINPITLPGGTVGAAYGPVQMTASNCVAPLLWSISAGSLPTGITFSSAGVFSGTPSGAGSSSFTVTLVDNAGNAPIFPISLGIVNVTIPGAPSPPDAALTAFDTSMAGTPTGTVTLCVGTPVNASALPGGGCHSSFAGTTAGFQAALNAVACGQIVNVASAAGGVTIQYGPQQLPHGVVCSPTTYVWVIRDLSDLTFPADGVRPDPCYIGIPQNAMPYYPYAGINPSPGNCARHMPQIISNATSNNACFRFSIPTSGTNTPSIAYWRIQGFDCTRDQSADAVTALVSLDYQPGQNLPGPNPVDPTMDCGYTGSGSTALPSNPARCQVDQPSNIVIAQNVIHGDAQRQTVRAVSMGGGTFIAPVNNYIYDIQDTFAGGQGDAQSFAGGFGHGYTGVGNWLFQNNFSASSSEGTLFCGAFTEAKSPITNADGIPTSVIWNRDWYYKPVVWDTQRGQSLNETIVNEGVTYPPQGDQEIVFNPLAFQVQQGLAMPLNNTWLNDSAGGWNRFNDSGTPPTATITVDGTDYKTVVSANGIVTKSVVTLGSAPWQIQNDVQWTYTACSGAGTPIAACTGATTPGNHVIVLNQLVIDGRAASLGADRHIINTVTATVTATAPTNQIFITPSAPDLQIQPSYSDSFNNIRNFSYVFTAALNFTSVSLTWKVDGIVNGNSTVGQICSVTAVPCTAPGSNDARVVYVSGTSVGPHTISVTSAAGTTTSQTITISKTSPIWAYDLKAMTVKNMWEAKCVNRGLLENSLLENTWGSQGNSGGQNNALLNQAINQASQTTDGSGATVGYGPQNISDFAADHVHILHAGGGLTVAALNQSKGVHRLKYSNFLLEDLNGIRWGHGFLHPIFDVFLQFSGTSSTTVLPWTSLLTPLANDINFSHITSVGGTSSNLGINSWLSIANNNAQFQLGPFSVKDSIFESPGTVPFTNNNGEANDCGTNTSSKSESVTFLGTGYTPAKPCFSAYSLARNLLVDNSTSLSKFVTSTIWQTTSGASDLFVNYNVDGNGGDYHIPTGSQYAAGGSKDASDGTNLGADIDGIMANDAAIRWGGPNPPTVDMLTVALMGTPSRLSNHMHGTVNGGSDTYSILDTDAGYPAGYPTGIFFWAKHPTGNPWDIEKYDSTYAAYHWITEDGDSVDQSACVAAGFSGGCFLDPNAYKRFNTPVPLLPRNFTYGTTVTIDTPGPNTFVRTTNCEATSTNVNLGDVRSVTTGPFLMTWGGTIDSGPGVGSNGPVFDSVHGVPTFRNDYYYGGTLSSGVFNDKESTFYVIGSGRVAWFFYQLSGGTYALQQFTINNTLTSGNTTANFPCGAGKPWWP